MNFADRGYERIGQAGVPPVDGPSGAATWRRRAAIAGGLLISTFLMVGVRTPAMMPYAAAPPEGAKGAPKGGMAECEAADYSKTTLKTAIENTVVGLLGSLQGEKKFEASDVIQVGDHFYVVCDNSWAILRIGTEMSSLSASNTLIGKPDRVPGEDSGYEAIFHDGGIFYVVRESVEHDNGFHAEVEELVLKDDGTDYDVQASCRADFEFQGKSKGFEGAVGVRGADDGELYMLGLCEGNNCAEGDEGKARGHGRVVVLRKVVDDDGSCEWRTMRQLVVPQSANFQDYSAISLDASGRVVISSQEESALWVGRMTGLDAGGGFVEDHTEFDDADDASQVLRFPRDSNCRTTYCNIEGVFLTGPDTLVAVSDKMKKGGKQDFRCLEKDQSVHLFVMP